MAKIVKGNAVERERKPEISVNLVRKQNEEYYRIVDDREMFLLKARFAGATGASSLPNYLVA